MQAKLAHRPTLPAHNLSKYDQACMLAAAIAFVVTQQRDHVAIGFATKGLKNNIKAGNSATHLNELLHAMEEMPPQGPADLASAIGDLAAVSRRRSLLIVLSDLYENRNEILKALGVWLHKGGEAILFHVLHPDELKLPDVGTGVFIDAESAIRMNLKVDEVRAGYEQKLRDFLAGWAAACHGRLHRLQPHIHSGQLCPCPAALPVPPRSTGISSS